jgi:hypothetical protein
LAIEATEDWPKVVIPRVGEDGRDLVHLVAEATAK